MGKALGLLLALLAIATVILFIGQDWFLGHSPWWFPENYSAHGQDIDSQFNRTAIVVGVAFVLAQLALGYAVFRFGRRGNERAVYSHGSNRLEITWTLITAAVFIAIAILGQQVWAQLHLNNPPPDAVKVSVVAQQFQWNFHYPGADNVIGRTDPKLIDDGSLNFVGLDTTDPNAKDDIQATTLAIPENRAVELILSSKDVIHSFFVPNMRFKQDAVPGLAVRVHFTPRKAGKYEIACAELCGNNHFQMKSFVLVLPAADYEQLSQMPEEKFKERMTELFQQY